MTDIVERLRDHDRHIRGRLIEGLTDLVIDDMIDAAEEIERLREALREFVWLWPRPYPSAPEDMMYQQACIDKARAALGEKEW